MPSLRGDVLEDRGQEAPAFQQTVLLVQLSGPAGHVHEPDAEVEVRAVGLVAGQTLGDAQALGLPLGRALAPELLGDPAVEPVSVGLVHVPLDPGKVLLEPLHGRLVEVRLLLQRLLEDVPRPFGHLGWELDAADVALKLLGRSLLAVEALIAGAPEGSRRGSRSRGCSDSPRARCRRPAAASRLALHAGDDPVDDGGAFELGEHAEQLDHQATGRGAGVEGLGGRSERDADLVEFLQNRRQVTAIDEQLRSLWTRRPGPAYAPFVVASNLQADGPGSPHQPGQRSTP